MLREDQLIKGVDEEELAKDEACGWRTIPRIAEELGLDRRTLYLHRVSLLKLVRMGVLESRPFKGRGSGGNNLEYRANFRNDLIRRFYQELVFSEEYSQLIMTDRSNISKLESTLSECIKRLNSDTPIEKKALILIPSAIVLIIERPDLNLDKRWESSDNYEVYERLKTFCGQPRLLVSILFALECLKRPITPEAVSSAFKAMTSYFTSINVPLPSDFNLDFKDLPNEKDRRLLFDGFKLSECLQMLEKGKIDLTDLLFVSCLWVFDHYVASLALNIIINSIEVYSDYIELLQQAAYQAVFGRKDNREGIYEYVDRLYEVLSTQRERVLAFPWDLI